MKKRSALFLLLTVFVLGACTKVEPNDPPISVDPVNPIRMIIANEGQYGNATASLTAVMNDGGVFNDVFRTKNNRPLGDVAQSIAYHDKMFYVTLNNSRKIEVMKEDDFESVATIQVPKGSIPTYMQYLGGDSMAVSDKGSGLLVIIDTKQHVVRRQISGVGSGNQMVVVGNKLFLAGGTLRCFTLGDIRTESMRTIVDNSGNGFSVAGDSKLVVDKHGRVWVLNSSKLVCIDPVTEKVVKELPFTGVSVGAWDGRLDISPDGERLYFAASVGRVKGVLRLSVDATAAPTELLFPMMGVRIQYNMAVSKQETILVCDVEYGSIARGKVHEYDTKGQVLRTIEAGIFPQYIYFLN